MKDEIVNKDGEGSGTSLTLLQRIRQKDQTAWERLVSLYSPLVFHWCVGYGLPPEDAEELGQDVFLAVASNIATFRRDRPSDTFRGWLRIITRNKVRDRTQPIGSRGEGGSDVQKRLQQVPFRDPVPVDDATDAGETGLLWRRAVELIEASFEEKTRRAFWLLLEGRIPAVVASELGMTTGAVYIAKSRVFKRLREEFGELLEPCPELPAANAAQNFEPAEAASATQDFEPAEEINHDSNQHLSKP